MRKKKRSFMEQIRTDRQQIGLTVQDERQQIRRTLQEIEAEMSAIMGLGVIQKKWRLDKMKKECERKLKKL